MNPTSNLAEGQLEVHDRDVLANARSLLNDAVTRARMLEEVTAAVERNEEWRGKRCINLLAPEAPTSPTVRALLSSEIGTRAAEGHIGKDRRWFAGTQYIDEVEALCVELLKEVFDSNYADHRLMGGMIANLAVYHAMAKPGDVIMSAPQPVGGHSSNRLDGPAGLRGLQIVDVPFDPVELEVDLEHFKKVSRKVKPKLVVLGMTMTLFPLPVREMSEIISEWGGKFVFDGAHQLGLIAGGLFQKPLKEGAAVLFGSAGKTFSGPQSGIIVWDDPELTEPITEAIFPVLVATHQVNRVAALAAAAVDFLEYGAAFMEQIVRNSKALGRGLAQRGIPVVGAKRGYSETHQVIADVKAFGGGMQAAFRLADANIIANKNLIPGDNPHDWDNPSGLRIGTIEVTRLGMKERQMDTIAEFIKRVLVEDENPASVGRDVIDFRLPQQTVYYCIDNGLPPDG